MKTRSLSATSTTALCALLAVASVPAAAQEKTEQPVVGKLDHHDTSPSLRVLATRARPAQVPVPNREVPIKVPLDMRQRFHPTAPVEDAARQSEEFPAVTASVTPAPLLTFEGLSDDDNQTVTGGRVVPPDTNGDVGPNHYVQWINLILAVWDKNNPAAGPIFGPVAGNSIWSGFGGICETSNDGDPTVLYDRLADRWVISQFAIGADGHQCIAVSTTGDPTGSYHRYDFNVSPSAFNDYPKMGVWPDGYYISANQFDGPFQGAIAVAFERDKMLLGQAAQMVKFGPLACPAIGECFFSLQPSNLEGGATPAPGTPNTFIMAWDDETWGFGTGPDGYRLWNFSVNWTTPASSTFTSLPQVNSPEYDANLCNFSACVTQPAPGELLDTLAQFTMYRAQYRVFPTYASLVVNHSVDANGLNQAGVRWAELRNTGTGWFLQQSGTFAPADGRHRWMGSIAQDKAGNIAIGYSVSSTSTFPSIRYTSRTAADPLGVMGGGEVEMTAGAGVQTGSSNRWGDYSSMSIDPSDDCTFWYTQEYYANTGSFDFKTRIGAFRLPECTAGLSVSPTSLSYGNVVVNTTSDMSVTLTNGGTTAVNVSSLATTNPVFSVVGPATPFVVAANGGTQVVTVRFSPTSVGAQSGTLEITSDDATNPLLTVALSGSGVPVPPAFVRRINSGGADFTDSLGNLFVADKAFVPGDFGYTGGTAGTNPNPIAGTTDDQLYKDVRGAPSFSYTFDSVPSGSYDITFYFADPSNVVGSRVFDVSVEGVVVLDNYDIRAAAGAANTAVTETVTASITDGQLNIGFTGVVGNGARVSAIAVVSAAPPLPTLSINDVSVTEGNAGTTSADFTVTLSAASSETVTVAYATADGTATAGSDYVATSGTLTFDPGVTSRSVSVQVNGDTSFEANETFLVNLSSPTNATIADGQGIGTIVNDDAAPSSLSINDVSVTEGNAGTTNANFTVTLSPASSQTVTVAFATADGTAVAPSDYVSTSGTLTFLPGTTTQGITVLVNGDSSFEPNETFFVNLSAPANATIADGQGLGTITNDDAAPFTRRINSGGADFTDSLGNLFVADKAFVPGDFGFTGGTTGTNPNQIAGTTDDLLYQTMRGAASFSYTFDSVPSGSYNVTFYFADSSNVVGSRVFDVSVEGVVVLDNYDIRAAAGAANTAVTATVVASVTDGQLNIGFTGVVGNGARISAIAVVPAP